MNEECFYIKPLDQDLVTEEISLYEIKCLAFFAIFLANIEIETANPENVLAKLDEYFNKNKKSKKASLYFKLQSAEDGIEFLTLVINMLLLEEKFKLYGITKELANQYNSILGDYNYCLNINNLYKKTSDIMKLQRKKRSDLQ